MEDLYTQNSIKTFTGLYVDFVYPKVEQFCIEDIAHALSKERRFGNHLPEPYTDYTVAQHCTTGTHLIKKEYQFEFLMHECSEAYMRDLAGPLKALIPEYKVIEDRLMKVISEKFGFQYPFPPEVKDVDRHMLAMEWDDFIISKTPVKILSYQEAYNYFMAQFNLFKRN